MLLLLLLLLLLVHAVNEHSKVIYNLIAGLRGTKSASPPSQGQKEKKLAAEIANGRLAMMVPASVSNVARRFGGGSG